MKKIYVSLLLLIAAFGLNAQAKLDSYLQERILTSKTKLTTTAADEEKIIVIMSVDSDVDEADIAKVGEVRKRRGDMCLVAIPLSKINEAQMINGIRKISLCGEMTPMMSVSRSDAGVSDVHSGVLLPDNRAYEGAGVVVGLMDVGLDPNHINFYDKTGTTHRVKKIADYGYKQGVPTIYETSSEIAKFTTDDATEIHGTHVLGIMTGAYGYDVSYGDCEYYGVAPGADIVIGCGSLYTTNILDAVDQVIEYAQRVGKPAVVNLSLGTNIGPHDGTDVTSRYLAEAGKEAIICIASGNEGDRNISLSKVITAEENVVKTIVGKYGYTGYVDIWSDSSWPISVSLGVYDAEGNMLTELYRHTAADAGAGMANITSKGNSEFGESFYGSIGIQGDVNEDNNRYNVEVKCDFDPTSNKYIGIVVSAEVGTRIDAYCTISTEFTNITNKRLNGWTAGTPDCSINSMACGENVIVVGVYSSQDGYYTNDSYKQYPGVKKGEIAYFSSYGTLLDGRKLPHVCAPGYPIVSSINTYYAESGWNSRTNDYPKGTPITIGENKYYWAVEYGTSMATPFVAGTIALWLEANPNLTYDDVLKIIQESSTRDEFVSASSNPVAWGAGKINAYEGILNVLNESGIESVDADTSTMLVTEVADNCFEAFVADEISMRGVLYNLSGQMALSVSSNDNRLLMDATSIERGIYVFVVRGERGVYTTRIAVK